MLLSTKRFVIIRRADWSQIFCSDASSTLSNSTFSGSSSGRVSSGFNFWVKFGSIFDILSKCLSVSITSSNISSRFVCAFWICKNLPSLFLSPIERVKFSFVKFKALLNETGMLASWIELWRWYWFYSFSWLLASEWSMFSIPKSLLLGLG